MISEALLATALEVPLAMLRERPLETVEIAVLDSGIDASHPRLEGRIARAYSVSTDAHGFVSVNEEPPNGNNDLFGHGTAVASIICDIAPNAELIDIRVLGANNHGRGEQFMKGFEHAVDMGYRIINMSLAVAGKYANRMTALCESAYFNNQVIVAARRNRPIADEGFPATFASTIGVDNKRFDDRFVFEFADHVIEYRAHGEEVAVAAPGGGYTTMTGTSFATPAITGMVALLVGAFPELKPFEVKAILKAFAQKQPA